MAIYAAALFTWGPEVNAAMAKFQQTQDPTVVQDMLGQIFGLAIVQLLAQVIVMVALLRAVISQNYREGVPLHLFSGMPDLRVLGVILLLVIAFMAGQTRPMWDFENVGDWWTRADPKGIAPVIAVPTSIGYGASFGGLAALLGMMSSCASNVTVVNIDNGFGAAVVASLINRS